MIATGKQPAPRIRYDAPFNRINGPDEYQNPMCTFHKREYAMEYGPLFEVAPALEKALQRLLDAARDVDAGYMAGAIWEAETVLEDLRLKRLAIEQESK